MSQGVEIFNLARTAYLRILPFLQPAAQVTVGVILGGIFAGPEGIFAGAAAGVAFAHPQLRQSISAIMVAFRGLLMVLYEYPDLQALIRGLIARMRDYLTGNVENDDLQRIRQ